MATWIKADGTEETVKPQKGKKFTLKELQGFVDGYIEVVFLRDGRLMVVNEEGKLIGLPFNARATELRGGTNDFIVGNALVCENNEID